MQIKYLDLYKKDHENVGINMRELLLASLAKHTPSMPIFGNRHREKACLLTNTRMIHTHILTINMNVSMNATL
jgi:hypothetical protein